MRILHLGLCVDAVPNGWQTALRRISEGDYAELNCGVPDFNFHALELAKGFKPELIFCQIQAANILTQQTAYDLSHIGFVVNFTGDVRHSVPDWMKNIGRDIQLTLFTNQPDVDVCLKEGINADFVHYGFDPLRYKKHGIAHACPEIIAMFNDYGENYFPLSNYRREIVSRLQGVFGDRFGVYGNYPGALGNFNLDQVRESQQLNSCKIAINCSHFNYFRYSSDRMLRILGSGALCLSHRFDGIDIDFIEGQTIVCFDDLDDLVKKCHHFLNNSEERMQIAENGYDLAHREFTFDNMAARLVEMYHKHKK